MGQSNVTRSVLLGLLLASLATNAPAQSVSKKEIDGLDERYAIASKHFGGGKVQLHTQDRAGVGGHKVHTFSCIDETFELVFEGDQAPGSLPVEGQGSDAQRLEKNTATGSMAQHACKEHGYPLLRMEW